MQTWLVFQNYPKLGMYLNITTIIIHKNSGWRNNDIRTFLCGLNPPTLPSLNEKEQGVMEVGWPIFGPLFRPEDGNEHGIGFHWHRFTR